MFKKGDLVRFKGHHPYSGTFHYRHVWKVTSVRKADGEVFYNLKRQRDRLLAQTSYPSGTEDYLELV